MSLLQFLFGAYVGWLGAHVVALLLRNGPKMAFMVSSLMVRRHVATVCLFVTLPLLAIAEWLLVTTNEGDQING